jgi:hypothetical protein
MLLGKHLLSHDSTSTTRSFLVDSRDWTASGVSGVRRSHTRAGSSLRIPIVVKYRGRTHGVIARGRTRRRAWLNILGGQRSSTSMIRLSRPTVKSEIYQSRQRRSQVPLFLLFVDSKASQVSVWYEF